MNAKPEFCSACGESLQCGMVPNFTYKRIIICGDCACNMIEPIYKTGGCGGFQHLAFEACLTDPFNRKRRVTLKNYQKIFERLLHKYKFCCVACGSKESLSIDHIKPVAKGGIDDYENLQIMCKSCNSKKGAKYG